MHVAISHLFTPAPHGLWSWGIGAPPMALWRKGGGVRWAEELGGGFGDKNLKHSGTPLVVYRRATACRRVSLGGGRQKMKIAFAGKKVASAVFHDVASADA